MSERALGVDLGATWLRAALADGSGQILRRWKRPAVRWTALAPELKRLKLGKLDRLTVGPTGVWRPSDRRRLARALKSLARRVRVISDVELAHEAAFGGGPGILVIAGASHLADCALRVRRDLRLRGRTPLVCHGTMFKDPMFKSGFQKRIAGRFAVTRAVHGADVAAARRRN
ncbi:MAG: hypothetical protein HY077_02635 [Elusimicrobia bacterium]|nr:hypothetical protein [Elusimicrobiota bacterium]